MKMDELFTGVLLGVALGIHYSAGLGAYFPIIVLLLVISAAKHVLAGKK